MIADASLGRSIRRAILVGFTLSAAALAANAETIRCIFEMPSVPGFVPHEAQWTGEAPSLEEAIGLAIKACLDDKDFNFSPENKGLCEKNGNDPKNFLCGPIKANNGHGKNRR